MCSRNERVKTKEQKGRRGAGGSRVTDSCLWKGVEQTRLRTCSGRNADHLAAASAEVNEVPAFLQVQ